MKHDFRHRSDAGGCSVKLLALVALVMVIVAAAWVLLMPRVVSSVVRKRTGFEIQVQRLSINPFTANVAVRGLVVQNPADWPERAFLDLREFKADVKLFSLLGKRLEADEVVLDVARVTLVRRQDGGLNAMVFKGGMASGETAAGQPPPAQEGEAPQFFIKRMVVRLDHITYADHSGRQPRVREYPVAINRELADVDSIAELMNPLYSANVAVVTEMLGGMFTDSVEMIKGTGDALKDAGQKATESVKGFLDKLKPKN